MKSKNNKNNVKLILGGAQLGLKYGVLSKKISLKKINSILKTSLNNKISIFDTARNYDASEKNIGNYFQYKKKDIRIITKLLPFKYRYSDKKLTYEAKKSV